MVVPSPVRKSCVPEGASPEQHCAAACSSSSSSSSGGGSALRISQHDSNGAVSSQGAAELADIDWDNLGFGVEHIAPVRVA